MVETRFMRQAFITFRVLILCFAACGCSVSDYEQSETGEVNASSTFVETAVAGKPNIVLFLFDDAGYSDLSTFGGEIDTPTVTRLANEGTTIARFYTAARCSPTRAGILTGKYPHVVGMADLATGRKFETSFPAYRAQLPLEVPLVSELFQAAGYRTLLQGKWHLGRVPSATQIEDALAAPNRRGFDHFVGLLGGQAKPFRVTVDSQAYQYNGTPLTLTEDWFSVEGLNSVSMSLLESLFDEEPDTPFFLYVASQAPHLPVDAPDALIEKYERKYEQPLEVLWNGRVQGLKEAGLLSADVSLPAAHFTPRQRKNVLALAAKRAAMLEAADAELGKLVDLLERRNKLHNTLIIVASDNGASAETAPLTNAPFRGAKGNLWEGATLSPLVAHWPEGRVVGGGVRQTPTSYLDIMPTLLEAAGVEYPVQLEQSTRSTESTESTELPGSSFLPVLRGESPAATPDLFWNLYGRFAVLHQGRWKLLAAGYSEERERQGLHPVPKLFDLLSDPAETNDVSSENPETAAELLRRYQEWSQTHNVVEYYKVRDAYAENEEAIRQDRKARFERALRQRMQQAGDSGPPAQRTKK